MAKTQTVQITAPNLKTVEFTIQGDAPYVQNRFSNKTWATMRAKQEAGSTARKGKAKDPKNFQACYEEAKHVSREGWLGIPAPAFRNAMISACRLVNFKMTLGKLSVFAEADGVDAVDAIPLVRITKGEPHYFEAAVRNATGVSDIRPRPMWDPGWEAVVRIRFDADQFTLTDVTNLMVRAGMQVGIGEGRPDSRQSAGLGWGTFRIKEGA